MNEAFLHHIWQFKLWDKKFPLKIFNTDEEIEIVSVGTYNKNEGPDFFNAKIKQSNLKRILSIR